MFHYVNHCKNSVSDTDFDHDYHVAILVLWVLHEAKKEVKAMQAEENDEANDSDRIKQHKHNEHKQEAMSHHERDDPHSIRNGRSTVTKKSKYN